MTQTIKKQLLTQNRVKNFPLILEALKNLIVITATTDFFFKLIVFPIIKFLNKETDIIAQYLKTNKTLEIRKEMPLDFLGKYTWEQAKMGLSQLKYCKTREMIKKENGQYLYNELKNTPGIILPKLDKNSSNCFWQFPISFR